MAEFIAFYLSLLLLGAPLFGGVVYGSPLNWWRKK